VHTKFWPENLKGKDHLEDLSVDGILLEWILGKHMRICGGFIWLMIGTSGGLL